MVQANVFPRFDVLKGTPLDGCVLVDSGRTDAWPQRHQKGEVLVWMAACWAASLVLFFFFMVLTGRAPSLSCHRFGGVTAVIAPLGCIALVLMVLAMFSFV